MCFECSDLRKTLCFPGLRRFRCGEKLARVRHGVGRRCFAVESCPVRACSVRLRVRCLSLFSLFFVDAVLAAIVLCSSASADRSGMAASRCLERCLFLNTVLRFYCVSQVLVGRSHWNCHVNAVFWMFGFARNVVCFSGLRRSRCGAKLARVRDGVKRHRFAVESCRFGRAV